jgi:PAS domain-containing protein
MPDTPDSRSDAHGDASIVADLPDVVLQVGRDGHIRFANPAGRRLMRVGSASAVGRRVSELTDVGASADAARRLADAHSAVVATGEPATVELAWDEGDAPRWFDFRLVPEHPPDGAGHAVETVLAVGREVTATHRAA